MRKITFLNNGVYHIYNRGVEKRKIFLDEQDFFRFIHDLYEFNDEAPAVNIFYKPELYEAKPRNITTERKSERKLLVEILVFCLMPNHFHLLLRQARPYGIKNFMHKLGTGYAMSFNQKYERVGSLFQGPFKAVAIEKDAHFLHLPYYIHCNPLDLAMPEWREKKIKDHKKAMEFLESYRWSSFQDYIGKKNFPSVIQRDFLTEFLGRPEQYKKDTIEWLKEMDLETIEDLIIE